MNLYTLYSKIGFDSVSGTDAQIVVNAGRKVFKTIEAAEAEDRPGKGIYIVDTEDPVDWETEDTGVLTGGGILREIE